MEVFMIFYGLIEAINSIYVYKKKNKFNLFITTIWGIAFILVGLIELFNLSEPYRISAYTFWGLTWFPMMFTPCGIPIFRINKTTLFIRKIVFCTIGLAQFYYLYLLI